MLFRRTGSQACVADVGPVDTVYINSAGFPVK